MVISEAVLRRRFAEDGDRVLVAGRGDIVTPAARDFAREHGFTFVAPAGGGGPPEKPEHMTHLRPGELVEKTHPRIRFRGKLDTLQAFVIDAQLAARAEGNAGAAEDLGEVLAYARDVLGSEVKGAPFPRAGLFGLGAEDLRSISHRPEAHHGVRHTPPDESMGRLYAALNVARTLSREAELACLDAFGATGRPDLALAMNRLSSGIYIIMCRLRGGYYGSMTDGKR